MPRRLLTDVTWSHDTAAHIIQPHSHNEALQRAGLGFTATKPLLALALATDNKNMSIYNQLPPSPAHTCSVHHQYLSLLKCSEGRL